MQPRNLSHACFILKVAPKKKKLTEDQMKTTFFSLLINSSPAFKDRLYSFFEAFKKHLLFLNE